MLNLLFHVNGLCSPAEVFLKCFLVHLFNISTDRTSAKPRYIQWNHPKEKQGDKLLLSLQYPACIVITVKTVFCRGATELLNSGLCSGNKNHDVKIRKYEIFARPISGKFIRAG